MKKDMLLIAILIVTTIYIVIVNGKVVKTITYFPINKEKQFKTATTSLIISHDNNKIHWHTDSLSDNKAYLRQDISLLYLNGSLKGVLNKWEKEVNRIEQAQTILINKDVAYYQAISYHHGEYHDDNEITSIQQMSMAELYLHKGQEKDNDPELKQQIKTQLHAYWDNLMIEYDIDEQAYSLYALDEIKKLYNDLTTAFSSDISEPIIGQLWEGLYKNYILEAARAHANDMMPLILLAKDSSHIIVLYTINGETNQLIQRLNTAT